VVLSPVLPMMGMVVLAFCPVRIASSPAEKMGSWRAQLHPETETSL